MTAPPLPPAAVVPALPGVPPVADAPPFVAKLPPFVAELPPLADAPPDPGLPVEPAVKLAPAAGIPLEPAPLPFGLLDEPALPIGTPALFSELQAPARTTQPTRRNADASDFVMARAVLHEILGTVPVREHEE